MEIDYRKGVKAALCMVLRCAISSQAVMSRREGVRSEQLGAWCRSSKSSLIMTWLDSCVQRPCHLPTSNTGLQQYHHFSLSEHPRCSICCSLSYLGTIFISFVVDIILLRVCAASYPVTGFQGPESSIPWPADQ